MDDIPELWRREEIDDLWTDGQRDTGSDENCAPVKKQLGRRAEFVWAARCLEKVMATKIYTIFVRFCTFGASSHLDPPEMTEWKELVMFGSVSRTTQAEDILVSSHAEGEACGRRCFQCQKWISAIFPIRVGTSSFSFLDLFPSWCKHV